MSNKPNNPKAFPSRSRWDSANEAFDLNESGMTLRDYFAAKAIVGLMATLSEYTKIDIGLSDTLASEAYLIADAMLKARKTETP